MAVPINHQILLRRPDICISLRQITVHEQSIPASAMDDYTFQQELEALAGNAFNPDFNADTVLEPMEATIDRWKKLFNLSGDEAVDRIQEHRNNLTRTRITYDHWEMIRSEKRSCRLRSRSIRIRAGAAEKEGCVARSLTERRGQYCHLSYRACRAAQ